MSRRERFTAAGIDGARGGWVMATVGEEPAAASTLVFAAEFAMLLDRCRTEPMTAVGVDIPIGFAPNGDRGAEREARGRLGRRASTLFPSPAHAVLALDTWPEALALNRLITGKGFSKQAFHLLERSREVRAALGPTEQPWCSEVHPESSFTAMNDGVPLLSKHTDDGRWERLALVTGVVAADADSQIERSGLPPVDALDAYAAAWTARRIACGTAELLGSGTDPDGYSLTLTV